MKTKVHYMDVTDTYTLCSKYSFIDEVLITDKREKVTCKDCLKKLRKEE